MKYVYLNCLTVQYTDISGITTNSEAGLITRLMAELQTPNGVLSERRDSTKQSEHESFMGKIKDKKISDNKQDLV